MGGRRTRIHDGREVRGVRMEFMFRLIAAALLLAFAGRSSAADLDRAFGDTVRPFLQTYCLDCHGGDKPKGNLDLGAYASADAVARDHRRWDGVVEQLRS